LPQFKESSYIFIVIIPPFSNRNKHRPIFYFSDDVIGLLFIECFYWYGRIKLSPTFRVRDSLIWNAEEMRNTRHTSDRYLKA